MTKVEERMTEIEKKQAYWKGFVSGVASAISALLGLSVTVYYLLEIFEKLG